LLLVCVGTAVVSEESTDVFAYCTLIPLPVVKVSESNLFPSQSSKLLIILKYQDIGIINILLKDLLKAVRTLDQDKETATIFNNCIDGEERISTALMLQVCKKEKV
jgi:hypothetical protein